jgi:DNA-binding YbaB/EbfC family protein
MKGGAGPGGFNMGDLGGLLKQAQDMQRRMTKLQEDLKERVVEFAAGGGMVAAQANGAQEIVSVKISKEVVDAADIGMLEDLIVAAVNGALKKANDLQQKEMAKIAGGLSLPGLGGLPGMV